MGVKAIRNRGKGGAVSQAVHVHKLRLVSNLIFKDSIIDVSQSLLDIHLAALSWQLHY